MGDPGPSWRDEFWQNPWDLGGLVVIGLFLTSILLLMLFALLFGLLFPSATFDPCEEQRSESSGT